MQARVLLICAERIVAKHLATLFARHGYACHPAPTFAAALDELRRQPYHLAVIDLDLLGHDQVAAARRLRGTRSEVRLVALDTVAEHRVDAGSPSPFDAVIAKPFFVEPLLAALPELLPCGPEQAPPEG